MTAYGADVCESPLRRERTSLRTSCQSRRGFKPAGFIEQHGEAAFAFAVGHGGEGIVGKDAASTYGAGPQATG